jgi:hypothetical protein
MNDKPDAPQPAQMTEYEELSLQLLHSIDQRLKAIEETTSYFQRLNQSSRDAMLAMSRMRP